MTRRDKCSHGSVRLWDAINALVVASGGRANNTSVARQKAVPAIEDAVDLIVLEAREAQGEEEVTDHLKLTDEVLERATVVLDTASNRYEDTRMFIAAIRALRDAARKVVEAERQGIWIVVERRIGDLEDLLPDSEVKP